MSPIDFSSSSSSSSLGPSNSDSAAASASTDERALPPARSLLLRWVYRLFIDQWSAIDEEAGAERAAYGARFDPAPLLVLVLASLVLVFEEYWGDRNTFNRLFSSYSDGHWYTLQQFAWWSGAKLLGFLVVPALALKLAGYRLADIGLTVHGFRKHLWIYLGLFLGILPVIILASYTQAFQQTYPFYKAAVRSWTDLIAWEALYALSFLALEFFFRGFLLFPLRRRLGSSAIFVMVIPYCMVHFGKPVAEVMGAVFAGIVLGTLALRTRSIWCGVLLHVSVALTMDLLALYHTVGFPNPGRYVGS